MMARIFLVVIIMAFVFSFRCFADDEIGVTYAELSEAERSEIASYFSDLSAFEARFVQYSRRTHRSSLGTIRVVRPDTVIVEYITPKNVSIMYSLNSDGIVRYHDASTNGSRSVKADTRFFDLLLTNDIKSLTHNSKFQVDDNAITVVVRYDQGSARIVLNRSPDIDIKSVEILNKADTLLIEFFECRRNNVPPTSD